MDARRPFVAIQRPGLDGRDDAHRTVEAMADAAFEAIVEFQPRGPYWLGGHSFGAWVAHEVARRLVDAGHGVARLVVLDMPGPGPTPLERPVEPERLIATLVEIVEAIHGQTLTLDPDELTGADRSTRLSLLLASLEAGGILPVGAGLDRVRGMIEVLEADEQALAAYHVTGTAPFPISVLSTGSTWDGSRGPMAEPGDASLGWQRLTSKPVVTVAVAGNHSTMLNPPHVDRLARVLDAQLLESQ
jgi:thioesterase domain-containing protein